MRQDSPKNRGSPFLPAPSSRGGREDSRRIRDRIYGLPAERRKGEFCLTPMTRRV
jgi:hypothetical protein